VPSSCFDLLGKEVLMKMQDVERGSEWGIGYSAEAGACIAKTEKRNDPMQKLDRYSIAI
jgi:hypothetical protein